MAQLLKVITRSLQLSMSETPTSPGQDISLQEPADAPESGFPEGVISYGASEGPGDLEAVLAAALDEDDLPDSHPPAPTPTLEAATARPTVGSYGTAADPVVPIVSSYGMPEEEASTVSQMAFSASESEPAPDRGVAGEPTVATTLEVPPLSTGLSGDARAEGGEFDLLIGKVKDWFEQADLGGQWDRLNGPLRGVGLLLGGLLVIKLYLALLDTLDDVPLLPRLLQLGGLIWLLNFSVTRLTRSSDRKEILEDWKRRWDAFRGS